MGVQGAPGVRRRRERATARAGVPTIQPGLGDALGRQPRTTTPGGGREGRHRAELSEIRGEREGGWRRCLEEGGE